MSVGWRRTAIGASVQGAAEVDVAMGEAGGGEGGWGRSERVHAARFGGAAESTSSSSGGTSSSLDRFLLILGADDTKKLGVWIVFALVLARLRYYYGMMLGTFVVSYMGNTVIEVGMWMGNRALQRMGECVGWRWLPKKFTRFRYASVYVLVLLTVITSLIVVIARLMVVQVENDILLQRLTEQNDPCAVIASWVRSSFGQGTLTQLEPLLLSVTGDPIFAGYPDNSLVTIGPKLENNAVWGEERYAQDAELLQAAELLHVWLSLFIILGLSTSSGVAGGLTKFLYKAVFLLLSSSMVIWDLPRVRRGMAGLKSSRLGFAYNTISPPVSTFAKLLGKSFEMQLTIAVINTTLTTAGLIALGVSRPLVLSFIVFLYSFVPLIGGFLSTLTILAFLGDGMFKVFQVLLMIFGVRKVKAYFLNPQIYASRLKLNPVVVIVTFHVAEYLLGVQGLTIAASCAVFIKNRFFLGNTNGFGDENGASTGGHSVTLAGCPKMAPYKEC